MARLVASMVAGVNTRITASVFRNFRSSSVSGQFSYDSNEDAFVTRTRTLSTWIISPVEVKL